MKKGVVKIVQAFLVFIVALIFVSVNLGETQAGTFQIPPKGKKKIKIAVVDWYSGIEVSALTNNYYKKWAKERGWDLQIFDVGADPAKAQTIVQNVITAGYDGIIVNWTDFKYYDQLVMKAYKAGIPLQGIACGNIVPGVISHGISADMSFAALSSVYLASKLRAGDKIILWYYPVDATSIPRVDTAKLTFKHYKMKIGQEIHWTGQGDPAQHAYESVKNAILTDKSKEIKGVWTPSEGMAVVIAKAALDMMRPDILVATCEDSPGTYNELRKLPNFIATAGTLWDAPEWTLHIFRNFDKIFAGKPFEDGGLWFSTPALITKDNLPPPGYYFNPCGYKGRTPDFKVK